MERKVEHMPILCTRTAGVVNVALVGVRRTNRTGECCVIYLLFLVRVVGIESPALVPCKHIKQKKPVCETSYINSTHSQYNMETPSLVLSRNLFDINPDTPRKRCRLVTQSAHFEERNVESLFAPQLSSLTHEDGIKRISFPSNRSVRFENALLKMRGGDALRRLEKERDDEIAKREQPVIRLSSVSVKTAAEIPAAATMNLGRQAPQRSRSGAARTA